MQRQEGELNYLQGGYPRALRVILVIEAVLAALGALGMVILAVRAFEALGQASRAMSYSHGYGYGSYGSAYRQGANTAGFMLFAEAAATIIGAVLSVKLAVGACQTLAGNNEGPVRMAGTCRVRAVLIFIAGAVFAVYLFIQALQIGSGAAAAILLAFIALIAGLFVVIGMYHLRASQVLEDVGYEMSMGPQRIAGKGVKGLAIALTALMGLLTALWLAAMVNPQWRVSAYYGLSDSVGQMHLILMYLVFGALRYWLVAVCAARMEAAHRNIDAGNSSGGYAPKPVSSGTPGSALSGYVPGQAGGAASGYSMAPLNETSGGYAPGPVSSGTPGASPSEYAPKPVGGAASSGVSLASLRQGPPSALSVIGGMALICIAATQLFVLIWQLVDYSRFRSAYPDDIWKTVLSGLLNLAGYSALGAGLMRARRGAVCLAGAGLLIARVLLAVILYGLKNFLPFDGPNSGTLTAVINLLNVVVLALIALGCALNLAGRPERSVGLLGAVACIVVFVLEIVLAIRTQSHYRYYRESAVLEIINAILSSLVLYFGLLAAVWGKREEE